MSREIKKTVTNLVNIQVVNFKNFLKKGLHEELIILEKIKNINLEIKIKVKHLKYKKPQDTPENCIIKSKSYNINLYCPIQIIYKNKTLLKKKLVFIGKVPLMTENGSFIINGNPRTIINQIIRSPGIYFEKQKKDNSIISTIIPNKGSWITIKMNQEKIYIKIDKMRKKIPLSLLLNSLGITKKKIFYNLQTTKKINHILLNDKIMNTSNALIKLNEDITEKKVSISNSRTLIKSKFIDENKYNLNKIGRRKINKKIFNKKFWSEKNTLNPEDILGSLNFMLKIKNGNKNTDEVDSLKNKRIRNSSELIKNQIKISIFELVKDIKDNLKTMEDKIKKQKKYEKININEIINNQVLTNIILRFFTNNPLSQIMDETNALAEITQKRKISSFGVGAIDKKRTNLDMREIHISYFGRICPIETTEGKNAGLILALSKETRVNHEGFLQTPVYKIINGRIKKRKGIFFITSEQEKNLGIIPSDIIFGKNNKILYKKDKKVYTKQGLSFTSQKIKNSNFIHINTNQTISIGTNLIPFLEHDDANRALMGSNMQRQALSVKKKEKPKIETGMEIEIAKNSQSTIKARRTSFIEFVSTKKIITNYFNQNFNKFITFSYNKKIKNKISTFSKIKLNPFKRKLYLLENNRKSNQNTFVKQETNLKKGEYIKKGQVIADGISTHQGQLALGRNVLIGYISWEGYNFEDAIIISKKLIDQNIFTSLHLKKYKTFVINEKNEEERITNILPKINIQTLKILKKNGIIKLGTEVKNEEIIIGKTKQKKEKSLLNKILNSIFEKDFFKDTSLKIPKGNSGVITKITIKKRQLINIISVYITENRKIEVGDKIAGRHGNKGIISKILAVEDMPFLQDGTPLDILLNPLGIPSRMNVGQLLECLLTLAGENLKENYKMAPFDEMQRSEISRNIIYKKLNEAKQKSKKEWLFNTRTPGKTVIFDGRIGLPFQQPIFIGYAYMLKLMHLVKDKINIRLTGPYSLILKQPLRGKCRNGGQRFGEMEVWALEGFGVAYTLQEMLTLKSDDLTNRSKILFSIINNSQLPSPGITESLKILFIEIQAILIELRLVEKVKHKLKI